MNAYPGGGQVPAGVGFRAENGPVMRCLGVEEAEALAGWIRGERRSLGAVAGADSGLPVCLTCRDSVGTYWLLDVSTGQWLGAWARGAWARGPWAETWVAGRPSMRLEAPVRLVTLLRQPPRERAKPSLATSELQPAYRTPAAVIAAYRGGQLDSEEAEAALRMLMIVDRSGAVWASGAISGGIYRFDGSIWSRLSAPPPPETIVPAGVLAGRCPNCGAGSDGGVCPFCGQPQAEPAPEATACALAWLAAGSPLPEAAAAPWQPPRTPPLPGLRVPSPVPSPVVAPPGYVRRRSGPGPVRIVGTVASLVSGVLLLGDAIAGGGQFVAALKSVFGG